MRKMEQNNKVAKKELNQIMSLNSNSTLETIIGLNITLILSKELFKKNKDIANYLDKVFEIQFKDYVMDSRTLIIARVSRAIYLYPDEKLEKLTIKMKDYFIDTPSNLPSKISRRKNENENMKKWIRSLNE